MATATGTVRFTHGVSTPGPAQGMSFTGRRREAGGTEPAGGVPLIIAVHGGTYTSEYFDIPGHSLLGRAEAAGIPVVAIDRPSYGGSTPVAKGGPDSVILENAEVLDHLAAELWARFGTGTAGVVLVGHSIGGAVVIATAARAPSWPLLGIAVSGCLLQVPQEQLAAFGELPDAPSRMPQEIKDAVMFGPPGTYDADMPQASHPSDAPTPPAELIDINTSWPQRVRSVAAQVTVPVHSRQGEFDRLWLTDARQVEEFGAAFDAAPHVDARLVRSAGHCVDFHRAGAGFQLAQLAFALDCCVPAS